MSNNLYLSLTRKNNVFDCSPSLEVRGVFLDISKAFDKVWHDGLIYKLKRNGIICDLLMLIESFLSDRYQGVVLNRKTSNWNKIKAGVPQRSILGQLNFLISINDLPSELAVQLKSLLMTHPYFLMLRMSMKLLQI